MVLHHSPKRLYDICVKAAIKLINDYCKALDSIGNYEDEECKRSVTVLNNFFSSNLPARLIDDLHLKWTKENVSFDARMATAILMHPNVKYLKMRSCSDKYSPYLLIPFWSQFCYKNITYLDCAGCCTDELLELFGQQCKALQYIDISSFMHDGNQLYGSFVTDSGLEHLAGCVKLKIVKMNMLMSEQNISVKGVRRLLKLLSDVANISFDDMGCVISDDMNGIDKLSLTHLRDIHPTVQNIDAAARLCSKLQHLYLNFFPEGVSAEKIINNDNKVSSVFDALTNSMLCVSIIEFVYFKVNPAFSKFLISKGQFITTMILDVYNLSTILIQFIGKHCHHIKNLKIAEFDSRGLQVEPDNPEAFLYDSLESKFSNLESFSVSGAYWNADLVLPFVILQAQKLKKLSIDCYNDYAENVDKIINQILEVNPLKELTYFSTMNNLRMNTLLYFIHLPNMKTFPYYYAIRSLSSEEEIEYIIGEVRKYNITAEWDVHGA